MNRLPGAALTALSLALLLVASAAAYAQSAVDRIKSRGVLVVATDPGWPPMSWRNEKGTFEGYDVDVTQEIARRLGVRVEFYMPYSFDSVLAGNRAGKWDVATSVTPTVQRAEKVQFAAVYEYAPSSLAVHRDNKAVVEPSQASGKRLGAVGGTEYEKYLTREPFDISGMPPFIYKINQPKVVQFADEDALFASLAKGDGTEIDGIVDDTNALLHKIRDGAPFRIVGAPLTFTPGSLVVERGEDAFAAALKEIIESMQKDGTLTRLSIKWFDFDLTHS